MDSNHRSETQQIYSLPHLATLETTLIFKSDAKVLIFLRTTKTIPKFFSSGKTVQPESLRNGGKINQPSINA